MVNRANILIIGIRLAVCHAWMHTVALVSLAVAVTTYSPGTLNVSRSMDDSLYGVAPAPSSYAIMYCMSEGPSTTVRLNSASESTTTTPLTGFNSVRRRPFNATGTSYTLHHVLKSAISIVIFIQRLNRQNCIQFHDRI